MDRLEVILDESEYKLYKKCLDEGILDGVKKLGTASALSATLVLGAAKGVDAKSPLPLDIPQKELVQIAQNEQELNTKVMSDAQEAIKQYKYYYENGNEKECVNINKYMKSKVELLDTISSKYANLYRRIVNKELHQKLALDGFEQI